MKYLLSILVLFFAIIFIGSMVGQNKPDGLVVKTTIPENPLVSILNDEQNPNAAEQNKEDRDSNKKYSSVQSIKPKLTQINKDVFGLDAIQTLIESGNEQYLGHSIVTERTGSVPGTIWVAAAVRSSTSGSDQVRIYRSGGNDWLLKAVIPLGGYLGYDIDAELIEHSSGAKYLWFVVERQENIIAPREVYYGIHELGTSNVWFGKLDWAGTITWDKYYNPRITSDNYDFPDDPRIYVVVSLDSTTLNYKHVYAQKFAYITSPYDIGNMQINYRANILPVFWPDGGTTEDHYLYSDITYSRVSPGLAKLIFTYSNVPDNTKIWLSTCSPMGTEAQFVGTIAGNGNFQIGNSAITSPGGGLSSQLMVVFEENYLNSGDWDLVSARSNDAGSNWTLNYIDGYSSTTNKIPHLGTLVSRKGVEDEYYVSYSFDNPADSIMSTKSNNGSTDYWDQRVKMNEIYPPSFIISSVGITNTPDERVTVWSSLIGSSNFSLIGSFWPHLPSSVENESEDALNSYQLFQNYPNPFNPTTNIEFRIAEPGIVSLKVFDLLGREVATLSNSEMDSGIHKFEFDASKLPSGIYFYKLNVGEFNETKKMVLIR